MFDIVSATPSAAVATAGTITFAFPAGKNAGSYALYGHKAQAHGLMNALSQDNGDFSLAFTTGITLTYNGATSIPANTLVTLQVNLRGQDDGFPAGAVGMKRMMPAPIYRIDLGAPITASSNSIAASQSVGLGASFLLNGVTGATLDVPRNIVAAWTTTSILTITGLDEYGDVIIEKSASGTSHTGKKAFKSITSISSSAAITSATVGFGDVLGLPVYIEKAAQIISELVAEASVGGNNDKIYLTGQWADISTADSGWLTSPVAGKVTKLTVILDGAITTADSIVTAKINTVAIVGLSVTAAFTASAAGSTFSDTPTLDDPTTVIAVGDKLEIITDGASSTAMIGTFVVEITPTATANGTFVAGVQTLPTATTGDTKGTYDPYSACNGTLTFSLIVALPDPLYKGVDNYDG